MLNGEAEAVLGSSLSQYFFRLFGAAREGRRQWFLIFAEVVHHRKASWDERVAHILSGNLSRQHSRLLTVKFVQRLGRVITLLCQNTCGLQIAQPGSQLFGSRFSCENKFNPEGFT